MGCLTLFARVSPSGDGGTVSLVSTGDVNHPRGAERRPTVAGRDGVVGLDVLSLAAEHVASREREDHGAGRADGGLTTSM
jgi:hypothetical protein